MVRKKVGELHLEERVDVDSEGKVLFLKSSIVLDVFLKDNKYHFISDKFLNISVSELSYDECIDAYKTTLYVMYKEYAMAADKELTKDAQVLKSKLQTLIDREGSI